MSGNDSRGEKTGMGKSKTHFRAKVLSQTTILEVSDQGRISPETVSFTGWSSASSNLRFSKILAVLSDLDWWVAGILVSQAGDRLQGDVSLESNAIMLDTLAKESQDHKARTLPPPKRPAPALTTLVLKIYPFGLF